jgi:hypothetical protein
VHLSILNSYKWFKIKEYIAYIKVVKIYRPKIIPKFKSEPALIVFEMATMEKSGSAKNVTLPVPKIREVLDQIVKIKFLRFKELYKVKNFGKTEIKEKELSPNQYFGYDPKSNKIVFALS